ncbi:MAG: type II secretion system F family protein [Elusimicrobia bacterium]|nr:type II secretion system F family protein [Elusimicrobiota bacterium]
MPKFLVTAKDPSGKTSSEILEAADINEAVKKVQARELFVISIQPTVEEAAVQAQASSPLAGRKFPRSGIAVEDLLAFSKQIATMLEAGVPLLRCLSVAVDQTSSRKLAYILEAIRSDVEGGANFSQSMAKHPRVFSNFWVSLIEVGEASGTLSDVLKKLAAYVEDAARFRAQIISALIYPAILTIVCVGAVSVFALFIGPTFEKIFKDMNVVLPGITVVMLGIFNFVRGKFFFIVAAIIGLFFLLRMYVRTPVGRWQTEAVLFSIPGIGEMLQLIVLEKFASQMAVLLEAGVPILYGLEIAERLVDNMIYGEAIRQVREEVSQGKGLSEPMEKSGYFPPMAVQMVKVGEETGELANMLKHVAGYYKQAVEDFIKRISTMIEPALLVIMGGVIGTIVVAMFLPLLDLSSGGM